MINVALMGYGVVGSGVLEVFYKNRQAIENRAGQEMDFKYILDIRDLTGDPYAEKAIKDFNIILNDETVKIVVETMGGLNPAFRFVKSCLEAGKSVVSSNKELVAAKGHELLEIALQNNVNFLFEASVGGGIPIIRPIAQCMAANDITDIVGILNGTTNYILTKMVKEHLSFEEALKNAQKFGYAERDPSADIDGQDACRKISILASLAYGHHIYPDSVQTEGIRNIEMLDVKYVGQINSVIKLIGRTSKADNGKIIITVSPAVLSKESQLASIDDVFNGIMVIGNATGKVVFYGRGAGKLPTASAVMADVVDAVKHLSRRKLIYWEDSVENGIADPDDCMTKFYIRATARSQQAMGMLRDNFDVMTFITDSGLGEFDCVFVTNPMQERLVKEKIKELTGLVQVKAKIRVLDY